MNTLEIVNQKSRERGLEFLVMGGLATNAHGYQRQTADMDLLVKSDDREAWKSLMTELGYQLFHEQGAFAQFSPPESSTWPVDLMFVNRQTFFKMKSASVKVEVQKSSVQIPSAEHLIALKLHALKHTTSRRELKDLLDVAGLIEANKIDINGKSFHELCERYGSQKIKAQIITISAK